MRPDFFKKYISPFLPIFKRQIALFSRVEYYKNCEQVIPETLVQKSFSVLFKFLNEADSLKTSKMLIEKNPQILIAMISRG
jgi:hypothetical protein